jgi:single-stranded-DNA-specific exonuclease
MDKRYVEAAIENQENIILVITMSMEQPQYHWYLLTKTYYPNVATYIPDRYDEGYGISFKGIDFADDNGIS